MTPDEKNAAHNLLFEQRGRVEAIVQNSQDPVLGVVLMAIIDILELQIRRIDELEHL